MNWFKKTFKTYSASPAPGGHDFSRDQHHQQYQAQNNHHHQVPQNSHQVYQEQNNSHQLYNKEQSSNHQLYHQEPSDRPPHVDQHQQLPLPCGTSKNGHNTYTGSSCTSSNSGAPGIMNREVDKNSSSTTSATNIGSTGCKKGGAKKGNGKKLWIYFTLKYMRLFVFRCLYWK